MMGGQPTEAQPPASSTGQPAGAQPTGAQPPAEQVKQNDLSGIMEENVDVSSLVANAGQNQEDSQALVKMPVPPHPNTTFDEQNFLQLLAGSISLTIGEKKRIIESIPKLSQFQIDELMKIFEEEKGKFAELEKKHADQIAELETQHAGSWQNLEEQQEVEAKKEQDLQQAQALADMLKGGNAQNDNATPQVDLETFDQAQPQNDNAPTDDQRQQAA